MAQPDLVAQKILATDPNVGFGESSVLPYRRRDPDTTGYEAMERAQIRKAKAEADRQKNNEDYYNTTIKNLPEYEREFDKGLSGWRNEIVNRSSQVVKSGGNVSSTPELTRDILAYNQAANSTKQLKNDLQKIESMPLGKYINRESVKGKALKNYTEKAERVNNGDKTAFSESIVPDLNDPEHFLFDLYLEDKHGKRSDTVTSVDKISYNGRGERILGSKTTAKFVTKDKNGNVVPGIDQSVIDEDLYSETTDPNTLQFQNALFSLADKQIENKALQLKESRDPRYADMGTTQIAQSISANPSDPHYKEFNKKGIAENLYRKKLEAFQRVSTDESIGSLNEYNKGDGGDGSKTKEFKFEPTVISQHSATGNDISAPGVVLSFKDKPLTLNVAANTLYDWGTGKQDLNNTNRVPVNATSIGYALSSKGSGKIISFKSVDEMTDYINTAPLKDINNLNLNQYIFGNIQEKAKKTGDTGEDLPDDKQDVNRSIAIKYDKNNETGAQINLLSGDTFNKRPLSADEQKVKDAWEKRMTTKKSTIAKIDHNKKTIAGF